MLKIDNQNINFNGQSIKDDVVLATFNASFFGASEINISSQIIDYAKAEANKEVLIADVANFFEEVIEKISTLTSTEEIEENKEEVPAE